MISRRILLLFSVFFLFMLAGSAQPRQGQPAEEIALPSAGGDTLRLSSFKGKVVLLDFWASWCVPCRFANKGMSKIYSKYKDKGFEILGVSLDERKNDWQKAVKQDKINWLQVNDNGGHNALTAERWNIYQIPTSYLVDKDGKVVAMDLEGKELEKAIRTLLGLPT